jgi:Major Facilitator Superfamily
VLAGLVGSSSASGLLPVVESFAVLQVTGSAGKLGIVLAGQGAVALLLSLAGGVAGDRFSRGRILIAASLLRMAAAASLAATLLTHTASFAVLLAVAVVLGCAGGFFGPVSAAVLPGVVPAAELGAANGLLGGISSAATIAAPAVGGVIVAALGTGAGFAGEAALLAVTAACLAAARLPAGDARPAAGRGVLGQLAAGWRMFARLRWLWLLTVQWTVFSFLVLAPVAVLGPAIAEKFLGGAAAWGLISSCLTLGAVGGQLAAGRIRSARPALLCACSCPFGVTEALALGLGAPVAVIGVAGAVAGFVMGLQFVIFQTTMQTAVPPAVLARVAAFDLLGSELGQPAGYALAGPLGAVAGLRAVLTASAVVASVAVAALALPGSLREPARALGRRAEGSIEPAGPAER